MTKVEELKELIKEIKSVENTSKEEFLEFFDECYGYEGCSEGLYVSLRDANVNFTIYFTNLDIYEAFKNSEDYEFIKEEFDEEWIEAYERAIEKADEDLMRNHLYYLNLVGDELRINEIVLDYYFENEEEFDSNTIWNAKDFIIEETIEQLEDKIEFEQMFEDEE